MLPSQLEGIPAQRLENGVWVFYWDGGLKLRKADLAIDFRRRQARAFISHAHTDHMARHEYALCTPATAALYQLRLGKRPIRELPYHTPTLWGGLRLTTYPAGHCLGSAMLLAEDGQRSLLYTGDFKLGESATAEPAELPHAEILVIESTYGDPAYRHRRGPRPSNSSAIWSTKSCGAARSPWSRPMPWAKPRK